MSEDTEHSSDDELKEHQVEKVEENNHEPTEDQSESHAEATENHPVDSPQPSPEKKSKLKHLFSKYWSKKKLTLPLSAVLVVVALMAVPVTRFGLLGIFMKKDVVVYTIDSKTKEAVLGTVITLDGKAPKCSHAAPPYPNCFGKVSVGTHKLKIGASYYKSVETTITIGLGRSAQKNIEETLVATGRKVSIRVLNKITGKPVVGVHVKAGSSEGVTNQSGDGSVVVSPSLATVEIEISGDGYNTTKTTVNSVHNEANFSQANIVPAGKVYFLSKLSGKIDLVKTDLDGSNRSTVLAGTGKEEEQGTILLASRDWKYLAMLAKRDSDKAKLYLIDTSNDKLTTMDEGNATFTMVGWQGHAFVYTVNRLGMNSWDPKQAALKSFDAESKQLRTLDETNAVGTNSYSYASEYFGSIYALPGAIVYVKNWQSNYYSTGLLNDKQATIVSIKPDGSAKTVLKSAGVPSGSTTSYLSFDAEPYAASGVYYKFGLDDSIYKYEDGKLSSTTEIDVNSFYNSYATYLISPDGNSTFWTEPRDGKNTLLIGDLEGKNSKTVASLSDFNPYGWFTNDYLLLSKKGSELYVMPKDGGADPIKISDYHKPAQNFYGYGGGYGGI